MRSIGTSPRSAPLAGVRVVELGEGVSAPYAARLLAELGADVIKVEPPVGDRSRRHGPFAGEPDPERSGLFHVLNFAKRGVVLDLDRPDDRDALDRMLETADVLVTNLDLDRRRELALDADSVLGRHASLIVTSVTPYGDVGPYAGAPGTSLTASALAGSSWVIGDPDRPPLTLPYDLADYQGGVNAAGATVAALLARLRDGEGQAVDISIAEVLASYVGTNARMYVPFGKPWQRAGRSASESGGAYPYTILPCKDGYVCIIGRGQRDWRNILAAMGDPEWAQDARFADPFEVARHHAAEADAHLGAWMSELTRFELLAIAREHGFAMGPVLSVDEVLAQEQFAHREAFTRPLAVGDHTITPPRAPFRFSAWRPDPQVRPAPTLGQHDAEILGEREAATR